jgi:hypothetical protein
LQNTKITQFKDSSTLTINNVQVTDEGMYACATGNSLGNAMANATLRVIDFNAIPLDPAIHNNNKSLFIWIVFVIVFCLLVFAIIMAACFYRR